MKSKIPSGCKLVPGYSNVAVSKSGIVYVKRKTGKFEQPPVHKNNSGYYHVTVTSDAGVHCPMAIHKLVAKTYLEPPIGYRNPVVNHIDCNKLNNHVMNLEYVEHSENDRYCVTSFGTKSAKPIIVEDLLYGMKNIVPSLSETARMFGCAPMTIHERLNKYNNRVWRNRYKLRYATDAEIEKVKGVL